MPVTTQPASEMNGYAMVTMTAGITQMNRIVVSRHHTLPTKIGILKLCQTTGFG